MTDINRYFLDHPKSKSVKFLQIILLSVITITFLVPFVGKAFHIDDSSFLDLGKFFFEGISNYYKKAYYYSGLRFENVLNASHSPLGIPLLDFIILYIFENPDEKVFHFVFLIFPVLAAIFTYLFFLRFSKSPFILSLLLLAAPPFVIHSNNLMSDICFYSLLIGGFVFYMLGVDKNSFKYVFISVFLFSLSITSSYQSIIFYPIFYLYSYLNNKNNLKYFYCMFASLLPIISWYLYHYFIIWEFPNPFNMKIPDPADKIITFKMKLIYYLSNVGLAFISPVILVVYNCKKQLLPLYLLALVFSMIFFISIDDFFFHGYSLVQKFILVISFFLSINIILNILYQFTLSLLDKAKNVDGLFLASWFLYFFIICVAFTPFGACRYLLPAMPPLLILLANKIKFNKPIYIYLLLMVIFTSKIAVADENYADAYRSFARNVKNRISASGNIWFTGEWGFRHYMTEEGYKYLTFDSKLEKNDLIIKPKLNIPMDLDRLDILLNLEKDFRINIDEKIKILSIKSKAGFYSHGFGFLPFWFDDKPLEHIEVYKVIVPDLVRIINQTHHETTVGEITSENIIGQIFISDVNNLSVIKVLMASYDRQNSPEIIFHLKSFENEAEDIARIVVPASKIRDNSWHSFSFPPLPNSKGQKYYFYLESPYALEGDAFTAWMSSTAVYNGGSFIRNHLPEKGDLTFAALANK